MEVTKNMKKILVMLILLAFFAVHLEEAFARAGGGRGGFGGGSFGSRGSRSYSQPSRPSSNQYQKQQTQQPGSAAPSSMPQSGGFMRNLAGGLAGGFLGSLLFSSLGFGGGMGHGGAGGGFGFLEIILFAGLAFVIYKMVKSKKTSAPAYDTGGQRYGQDYNSNYQPVRDIPQATAYADDPSAGLSQIRRVDPSFDESRFRETATDIFFKVQAAWMNRDIESSKFLFAPEILDSMRSDVAKMKSEGRINRLENIAMRTVEISEAWQEQGKDYITAGITANVLDYVTDESGKLIEGSRTEPVRFMEYWTFVRPVGTGSWQLSAIQQGE